MSESTVSQPLREAAREAGLPTKAVIVLAHLDPRALGLSLGLLGGILPAVATLLLVIRGGTDVGRNLSLLSQYFIGFSVTPAGSAVAFAYGFLIGFVLGYLFARLRNWMMHAYLLAVRRRAEREALSDMLDRIL